MHVDPFVLWGLADTGRAAGLLLSAHANARRLRVLGCGIFGIFKHSGNAAVEIYEGLLMLQHRGQDSAGIVSFDGERFRERKARAWRQGAGLPLAQGGSLAGRPSFQPRMRFSPVLRRAHPSRWATQDNGLVKDVFDKESMKVLDGPMGIGHVRYPTAGSATAQEAQPFFVNSPLGIYLVRCRALCGAHAHRRTRH